jgi:hypothetical protein
LKHYLNKEVNMEDEVIMEFLASEFIAEKKRLPEGTEVDALAIGFLAGTKLMNQITEGALQIYED